MKATINGHSVEAYYGPVINGGKWLFVRSPRTRKTYSVAQMSATTGEIVCIDPGEAIREATNAEIAQAFVSVS